MTIPLAGDSAVFIDLYARYRRDPGSVPADLALHFEELDGREHRGPDSLDDSFLPPRLLAAYRDHGHIEADLDPLALAPRGISPELELVRAQMRNLGEQRVKASLGGEPVEMTLEAFDRTLHSIYAGTATLEAHHVPDAEARDWLQAQYEAAMLPAGDADLYVRALDSIVLADEFEGFIRTKYPSKKRFGIEGAESLIVFLRELLREAAQAGCAEVVVGGMHRGRLSTLATVFGKSLPMLIAEIKGRDLTEADASFTGDVPYHLGLSTTLDQDGRAMRVSLLPHPSHLTVVAAVATGAARGRQKVAGSAAAVLPLLLHTDAAFTGQGLVSEILQLGGLSGYTVGGSVHLVVNNQIGFTTTSGEGRTSRYATDIGKAFGAPILHVNADDPLAVARLAAVAMAWRRRFGRDVLIDLVCYRRNGHNELDEPRFTQPRMWAAIDAKPPVRASFSVAVAAIDPAVRDAADGSGAAFRQALADAYEAADTFRSNEADQHTEVWNAPGETEGTAANRNGTGVDRDEIVRVGLLSCDIPADFEAHPKVRQFYEKRRASIESGKEINLATAEALAFGTLLADGVSVRLSGQDSVRGTFTQRHLAVHDTRSDAAIVPLAGVAARGCAFEAVNSPLSEYGVLSFEYGHSLADSSSLVMWEAQFGDFLNGAQVVVDQFIVSAQAKWRIASGLIVALPHGLEGQGPDHSSARIERLLHLCANGNIRVAYPTTPANLFHLIRRQVKAAERKPLFLIQPKSLLRLRACVSDLDALTTGTGFSPILVERSASPCRRLILVAGKIFYDLQRAVEASGLSDVSIVRIEELYPFPAEALAAAVRESGEAALVWCQEEPENQGAWSFVREELRALGFDPGFCGRPRMAAAAGGSIERHEREQEQIVQTAIG